MGEPFEMGCVRRVVLIGAECTGKSTLAKALSRELSEPWSHEYVREHVEKLNRALDARDLEPIARGQIRLEDEAYSAANRLVIHDTNLLSSIVYSEHYYGKRLAWVDEVFEGRDYWRYFLCQPDMPWEDDPGQREGPEVRDVLQGKFVSALEERGIPYVRLSGSLEDRMARALEICDVEL